MSRSIRCCLLEVVSALGLTGCFVPIPPHAIPVSEAPKTSRTSCNVTLVRKNQFAGSAPTHYISLDNMVVASLKVGEYTTFPISEGHHSLAVTWRVGDRIVGAGSVVALLWSPYTKIVEVDCRPSVDYLFAISSAAFVINENDRVKLKQVEKLDGDFALERNRYISPGPR